MQKKRLTLLTASSFSVVASSWLLSACGGGGGAVNTVATLSGTASVSSSATSRVARDAVNRLQNLNNILQQNSVQRAGSRSRGRDALQYDEETGLYYDIALSDDGARLVYYEDSGRQREVGECLYKETINSYELMFNILQGARPIRAYIKLAETNVPERVRIRARYEDLRTGEKFSIDGELIAQPTATASQDEPEDDGDIPPDWADEYEWWTSEDDYFFGDDYFSDTFCGDEEFFLWQDDTEFEYGEEECPTYDEFVDFEIVRFEGEMTYEGCGRTLQITNARVEFETGQLTGNLNAYPDMGTVEYNFETGEGQILLNTVQGQVTIQCRGELIEAIYPDGRREQVNLSQWVNPCAGV